MDFFDKRITYARMRGGGIGEEGFPRVLWVGFGGGGDIPSAV